MNELDAVLASFSEAVGWLSWPKIYHDAAVLDRVLARPDVRSWLLRRGRLNVSSRELEKMVKAITASGLVIAKVSRRYYLNYAGHKIVIEKGAP